jgi:hypothetical protein
MGVRKPLGGPDDPRHGKCSTYDHYGCKCDHCRAAKNLAGRRYLAKRAKDDEQGILSPIRAFNAAHPREPPHHPSAGA